MSRSRQNSVDDESLPAVPGGFNFGSRGRRRGTSMAIQPPPAPPLATQSTLAFPPSSSPDEETAPVSALNQSGPGTEHEVREWSNSPTAIVPTEITPPEVYEDSHTLDAIIPPPILELSTQPDQSSLAFPEIASPVESPVVDDAPAYTQEQSFEPDPAIETYNTVDSEPEFEPDVAAAVDSEDAPVPADSATPVRSPTPSPTTPVHPASPIHPATPIRSSTPARAVTPVARVSTPVAREPTPVSRPRTPAIRASTPVITFIHELEDAIPTPDAIPDPAPTPDPVPELERVSSSVAAPVRPATPARGPTPVPRVLTPAITFTRESEVVPLTPELVPVTALELERVPPRVATPVRPATPARAATPLRAATPTRVVTPIRIPSPRRTPQPEPEPELVPEVRADIAVEAFLQSGDLQAADEAIDHYKHILEDAKTNPNIEIPPVEQARVANKLSTVLSHRFEHFGDVDDIEEAVDMQIKLAEIAMSESSSDPTLQAESLKGLGKTLTSQFELTGDPADADLAVENLSKALDTVPEDSPARPAILGDMAKAQLARYMRTDGGADLDQALDNCQQAMNALPLHAPERAPLANTYGKALLAKFESSNNSEDIDMAVEHLGYAVANSAVTSPERPKRLRTYGDALLTRFKDQKDESDLQDAIDTQREALDLLQPDSAAVPEVQGSLAAAYHTRYRELGRKTEDLDDAINYYKQAVEETPFSSPEHARVTGMLGKAFMSKYRLEPDFKFLNYAVTLHKQALALTPAGNRHRFERLDNLGYAYSKRFRSYHHHHMQQDMTDRTEAINAFQEALRIIHHNPGHPRFAFLQAEIRRLG
ncbi:hypothetical protein FRC08_003967 [Ceratobasidium sp. 394]|nr:hypothetical protein FRC08_003967 [Ceratobasidium sp. 394]